MVAAEWDKDAGTRRVQPLRFERTDWRERAFPEGCCWALL